MQWKNIHVTDTEKWVCSCHAFLLSRWPICYHLVQSQKELGNILKALNVKVNDSQLKNLVTQMDTDGSGI